MTLERDLYETLGVARTASPEEIKKAFRKAARTWHPDLNPGDPLAEQRFREVQQAYAILSEPSQRSLYDRHGASYFSKEGSGPRVRDPQVVFSELMTSFFKRDTHEKRRGEDLRYHLSLNLEEVLTGTERAITVPREQDCSECRGTGADSNEGRRPCSTCDGLGELKPGKGIFKFKRPCMRCEGSGYVIVTPCKTCEGEGRVKVEDSLKVRVPVGVDSGQRLKLKARGNHGHKGGDPGDLFVVVHVKPHPRFIRQGTELLTELRVNFALAALGGEVSVPTLDGSAQFKLPPGVQAGRLFRLKGMGVPRPGERTRGDLHVRLVVETPTELNAEQKKALEALARASGSER